jgi:hypothetical protein
MRARSKRRFERRRRRRALLSIPLLLLFLSVAALGGNVVEVLGPEAPPRQSAVAPFDPSSLLARTANVPGSLFDSVDLEPRKAVLLPEISSQNFPPGSHISPRVRMEMARLLRASENDSQVRVPPQSSRNPGPLRAPRDRVTQIPDVVGLEVADPNSWEDLWRDDDDYLELIPGDRLNPVPEPGTRSLVLLGLVGLALYGRRRPNS